MPHTERILEDGQLIRMVFQRLQKSGQTLELCHQEEGLSTVVLAQDGDGTLLRLDPQRLRSLGLGDGDKVTLRLQDRGLKYEAVTTIVGPRRLESYEGTLLAWPRTLRRTDAHRLAEFVPDAPVRATFTNARNALLEGHVKGFGDEGVELALDDPGTDPRSVMRIGEESMLDVTLEQDLRLVAPARVAYFGEAMVGLTFTERSDQALLGRYQDWLKGQQRLQEERDQSDAVPGRNGRSGTITLPPPRLLVDRQPMILVITEREDFARRMAEAFGRKYGFMSLDYITGGVRYHLKDYGGVEAPWGPVKLLIVHNQLRLCSPLELTRQLVEKEKCPLPILLMGTEEDAELKRNRAIGAGAVDYFPVEPFRILSVLKKLDEVMGLFA